MSKGTQVYGAQRVKIALSMTRLPSLLLLLSLILSAPAQSPAPSQPAIRNVSNSAPLLPPPLPSAKQTTHEKESISTLFDRANQLYDGGKFAEAADAYQALLTSGRASPALYFNLGNAWFKAGNLGRAIAAYRQAEQLYPRDPDVKANLRFARSKVQGPTLKTTLAERALGKLNLNEWAWAASAGLWLVFGLLTLGQLLPALRRSLRSYTILGALLAALLCAACGAALHQDRGSPTALVITRDAVVRQGPLDEAKSVFTAHDGAELSVLDRKDNWLQVTSDATHLGWIRQDQVLVVGSVPAGS